VHLFVRLHTAHARLLVVVQLAGWVVRATTPAALDWRLAKSFSYIINAAIVGAVATTNAPLVCQPFRFFLFPLLPPRARVSRLHSLMCTRVPCPCRDYSWRS
jgi:hypothetical protein